MKFYLEIDKERAPSVHVVTDKVTSVITKIEELCKLDEQGDLIYGYNGGEICPLKLSEVTCFFTKDGKVFARVGGEEFVTKLRIKDIEEIVDDSFVKINQGCVANVSKIKKFAVTFGAGLKAVFEDGASDYVSRRELSSVKRRFGL